MKTKTEATTDKPWKAVEESYAGVVRIMRGEHKGLLAYYDDDEDGKAICYLAGAPALYGSAPAAVLRRWLRAATTAEKKEYASWSENDVAEAHGKRYLRGG